MTKRFFRAIVLVALIVLMVCLSLFSVLLYANFEAQAFSELKSEAHYIVRAIETGGLDTTAYLSSLEYGNPGDIRITWIAADGAVLYDSTMDASQMENHSDRQEMIDALANGAGQSIRNSSTLSKTTLNYARRLQDGTVLRLTSTRDSIFGMFLSMLQPAIFVIFAVVALALLLAYRVAKHVVRPLNALDLDHPEAVETYDELSPLLGKIAAQKEQLTAQFDVLRKKQNELATITQHMSEGLLVVDARTNLLFSNPSAQRLLHMKPEEKQSILAVNRAPALRTAVQEALAGKNCVQTMPLDNRVYQLMANPTFEDGRLAGATLILLDITEIEDRERLRREFTANVSHELRTPLTSISGFAELIRTGIAKPEDVAHFADTIYTESQRLVSLIEDILRLSQLDEAGSIPDAVPVRLDEIAQTVAMRLQSVAQTKEITLKTETQPCEIFGVQQLLDELVFNLCDNAIKYNRPHGSVLVRVTKENDDTVLSVCDTGIGIAAAEQPRVFERFYRVDKSHSKQIGGTGLGLSIVKHIAAFHHAQLSLRSEPNAGTCVSVRFPAMDC